MRFHQRLQPFRERRLTAADRAEQIEDLLALLQTLAGMAQEADDMFDRRFHAVEIGEAFVSTDGAVHEDPPEPLVAGCVYDLRLTDRRQQALRC